MLSVERTNLRNWSGNTEEHAPTVSLPPRARGQDRPASLVSVKHPNHCWYKTLYSNKEGKLSGNEIELATSTLARWCLQLFPAYWRKTMTAEHSSSSRSGVNSYCPGGSGTQRARSALGLNKKCPDHAQKKSSIGLAITFCSDIIKVPKQFIRR